MKSPRSAMIDPRSSFRSSPLGVGVSYIAMLTAFYVDNGPHLPLWDLLPAWSFWILPSLVGVPLLARAIAKRRRLRS